MRDWDLTVLSRTSSVVPLQDKSQSHIHETQVCFRQRTKELAAISPGIQALEEFNLRNGPFLAASASSPLQAQ